MARDRVIVQRTKEPEGSDPTRMRYPRHPPRGYDNMASGCSVDRYRGGIVSAAALGLYEGTEMWLLDCMLRDRVVRLPRDWSSFGPRCSKRICQHRHYAGWGRLLRWWWVLHLHIVRWRGRDTACSLGQDGATILNCRIHSMRAPRPAQLWVNSKDGSPAGMQDSHHKGS